MFHIALDDAAATFQCAADDTLLRAGLRAGLGLAYECNTGSCGACKVELVSGNVVSQRADAPGLSERDRAKNRILSCQSRPVSDCAIKAKLRPECVPHHRPSTFAATLVGMTDLTHDLREFRFAVPANTVFLPGQYALLLLPGLEGARAYSMSNVAQESGEWHFQIRHVPGGKGSAHLFMATPLGTQITIDGPYGMAYLRADAPRDVICIGGGSGLAPIASIARGFAREPRLQTRQLHFFYGARTPRDVCGEGLLQALPGFGERLHFTAAVSMPEEKQGWTGATGFIHDLVRAQFSARLPQYEYYFAGPPAMVLAVQTMLTQAKVPQAQIHYDSFY